MRPISDERWLMAQQIKHAHDMLNMTAKNSNKLLAGASAIEFREAWAQKPGPQTDLEKICEGLKGPETLVSDEYLIESGLTGSSGELKRNFLDRRRDEAVRYLRPDQDWNIDTTLVTAKDLKAGCEALAELFEGSATLIRSLVPIGGEQVVEFLSYAKQLCKQGARWLDH